MDDNKRQKLFGSRLYKMYRRMRYIRYLKKSRRLKSQQQQHTENQQRQTIQTNAPKKSSLSGKAYSAYRKVRYVCFKSKLLRKHNQLKKQAALLATKKEREAFVISVRQKEQEMRIHELRLRKIQKEEKQALKIKRRRLIRYVLNKQIRIYAYNLSHPQQYLKNRIIPSLRNLKENKEKRNTFLEIFANSTLHFVLSYLTIYIIGMLLTVWSSLQYDFKMIIFYYKVFYDIESTEWFGDAVRVLYSIMPLTGLLFGFVFLILYNNLRREPYKWKMFFFWGFIHGFLFFFGDLLTGTLMNKGFGYVILYFYYKESSKLVFSIFAFFVLVLIGSFSVKSILMSANLYFNSLNEKNRSFFMLGHFFLPVVAGTILLMALTFPDNLYYTTIDSVYYDMSKLLTIFVFAIPVMLSYRTYTELYFDEQTPRKGLQWIFLLILLAVILILRVGFSSGFRIGYS